MVGLGGGSSSQRSQSQSYGWGENSSLSQSTSSGLSQSTQGSRSATTQGIAFEDLFRQLYGSASSVAGRVAANTSQLTDAAQMLFSGGTGFLDQLSGGGAGAGYLESRLGENPQLDEQISALGSDIGQFFREQVNPAITSSAIGNGQLGGGRQGVAQGQAAKAAAREFATGATNLRAQDVAARDAAAANLLSAQTAAAGTGLNALPGLYGIASGGLNAELAPYQALASILGGPTTLTQSQSTSYGQSTSQQIAQAISEALGRSWDQSSASGSGSSGNFSLSVLGG